MKAQLLAGCALAVLLGACGGGGGGALPSALPSRTVTPRPAPTQTAPATQPPTAAPTQPPTAVPTPPPTAPPTAAPTPAPTLAPATPPPVAALAPTAAPTPPPATPPSPSPSPSPTSNIITAPTDAPAGGSPGLLIAVLSLIAVVAATVVTVQHRRRDREERATAQHGVADAATQLALGLDSMPADDEPSSLALWWKVLDDQQRTLAAALKQLARVEHDSEVLAVAGEIHDAALDADRAIDADRALRIGPPAPTRDQLDYSLAAVQSCSARLKNRAQALRAPAASAPPAGR